MGELADANEPLSIFAVYGPVPPEKVAVTVPSLPPLQLTSVFVRLKLGLALTVSTALPLMVRVHAVVVLVPNTVYVPAVVWLPNDIALPVPATGEPTLIVLFLIS